MDTKAKLIAAIGGVIAIAAGIGVVLFRGGDEPPPEATPGSTPVAEVTLPTPTPTLRERLSARLRDVTLDTSDAAVRQLVAEISSHPGVLAWLANEDLVRRFVAAVDNVAAGKSPRSHLEFLAPDGRFAVLPSGDGLVVDPASYRRYDAVTNAVVGLDSGGVGALYAELRPLVSEAYREIAPPGSNVDRRLGEAFAELLACPVVDGRIEVNRKVVTYTLDDPTLEGLSAAQRHLLRFGPDNVRTLHGKLRELRTAMLGE
jgi:hypothetical protein